MTIEIKNKDAKRFSVHCYSCWSVNEENGNYGPSPLEFWWLDEDINLKDALSAGKKHEQDKRSHQIVVSGH